MSSKKPDKSTPLSVGELMRGGESGFGKILERARALEKLNQQISRMLDDDLARNCQVANVRDGRLIFACRSAGSATRLRLQGNQLLEDLHSAGLNDIESIEVKMMVSGGTPPR
jgi:hypothetical protein